MTTKKIPARGDDFARKIKATGKQQYFPDSQVPGLRLRVTGVGGKSWTLAYKVKNHEGQFVNRTFSLGTFKQSDTGAGLTVKAARDEAEALRAQIRAGNDPAAERQKRIAERQAEEAARVTVADLYQDWFNAEATKRKDKGAEVARMFAKDILPALGGLDARAVQKIHISRMMAPIEKRGERIAGVVFSLVRQFFGWAEDRGHIPDDPSAKFRKRIGSTGAERERVLSDDELTQLFNVLAASGLAEVQQIAIKVQLGTACRIGELLKARWEHIDLEENTWTIPPENSKNGKKHVVHLSSFTRPLVEQLFSFTGGTEWLYPASRGTGHINEKSLTKAVADRQRDPEAVLKGRTTKNAQALILDGGQWRPHDLRRTAATLLAGLGVLPDIIERCLNHTEESKVKRIYQRHDYTAERQQALELLGERLALLESPAGNVVILKQA